MIFSNKKALRISMEDIPKYKRSSVGVLAMALKDGASIDGISVLLPNATDIVVVTEKGRVNRFPITGLLKGKRAQAGASVIKLTKGDRIKSIFGAMENNSIAIQCKNTSIIDVKVKDLKLGSSISTGEKVIPSSDMVVYCAIN